MLILVDAYVILCARQEESIMLQTFDQPQSQRGIPSRSGHHGRNWAAGEKGARRPGAVFGEKPAPHLIIACHAMGCVWIDALPITISFFSFSLWELLRASMPH